MTPSQQPPAETLVPAEVWAKIFSYLQPTNPPLHLDNGDVHLTGSHLAQRTFCGLPLVCRHFMDVLRQHPELPSYAVFRQKLSSTHLASLGAWLDINAPHIKSVTATSKAHAINQQLLAAFSRPNSKLETASFTLTLQQHISFLGCISHLRSCTLHSADTQFLDLASLQHLPHLKDLGLMHGRFYTVSAAVHLTQLLCRHCTVSVGSSQGSFVDTLIQLSVVNSIVTDLDYIGICACKALRDLKVDSCLIAAYEPQDRLFIRTSGSALVIPAGMSSLTNLTHLCIAVPDSAGEQLDLTWLYGMVTLERLQLDVSSCVTLSQELEALTRLSVLSVSCCVGGCVTLALDWASMAALQNLAINGNFKVDLKLLGLSNLEQLTSVSVDEGTPADDASMSALAIFINRLGALRPDVCLELHGAANLLSDEITTI